MPPRPRKRAAKAPNTSYYEQELSTHSFEELRRELLDIGESPGPIDASNREIYVRLLARKRLKLDTESEQETSSSSSTSPPSLTRAPISHATSPYKLGPALSHTPSLKPGTSHLKSPAGKTAPSKKVHTPAKSSLKQGIKMAATVPQSIEKFEVQGFVAAAFTPLTDSGELDLPVLKPYAEHLLKNGVDKVFVNGSTGESLSLTVEERKLLAAEWIRVGGRKFTVIVHVGCESLKDTCELAQHAREIGAAAIGVMPSSFFKPPAIENLILYLEKVVEAAPNLPLFYYHIPSMTGVNFSMEEFLDAASLRLPTLRGLKYSCPDLLEFGRCVVSNGGKYQIVYGVDQQVLGAFALGGIAAIGTTYNFAGKLNNRLLKAFQRRDMEAAKLEQRRSQAMIKLLIKYGGSVAAGKAIMKAHGMDVGPPRLPLLPLTPESYKSLQQDLTDIGFFEWA